MRTHASWSLALMALAVSGSLLGGCKSSKGGRKLPDSGLQDGGTDGGQTDPDGSVEPGTPGFKVEPTTGLQTGEDGRTATFTVRLTAAPTADVSIGLRSDDEGEGRVTSSATLVFTPVNWAAPQTVTVTGQNDDEADGDVQYKVVLAPATSSDSRYQGKDPDDVTLSNVDNDSAGFTLADHLDLKTSEAGTQDTFSIRLNTKPTGNVTVTLVSNNTGEVLVSPASLTFTADNWNAAQTVTVKGVDDSEADGPKQVSIVTSASSQADSRYNIEIPDVTVTNEDNDTAGITVAPTSGLRVSENGRQDQFAVVLNTRPTADVVIGLTSSDTGEATVSKSALTFTRDNWNAPQAVIVTGVNDDEADGNQTFTIVTAAATSTDARYNGVNAADVTGSNTDNDSPGVTVDEADDLVLSEAGGQASFTVVLNFRPTSSVTIPVSSSDTGEATVAPANLVFTTANWNAPQRVTITGVDDNDADGAQDINIVLAQPVSDDDGYDDLDAINVPATVTDNETAAINIVTAEPFETTEAGGTTTFTVALNSRPAANVTIPVVSADPTEITVSTNSLTFTPTDWASPKTVTLTGHDDDVADGNQPVIIAVGPATSTDAAYNGKDPVDPVALNVDDETAGVTIAPRSTLETSESGAQATFTVRLNTKPTADVSFALSVSDTTEASISVSSLTFTPVNWNAPQTVTLTGLDDNTADGGQPYFVVFGAGTSTDARYNGFVVANVNAINHDNDTPGLELVDAVNLTTSEAPGGTASFKVRLRSRPTDPVTLTLASSNTAEGTVAPTTLTFTRDNWNGLQTVTLTGVNDDIADGPQAYAVTIAVASADAGYNGLSVGNVPVTNTDNDTAGVNVVPSISPLTVSEAGTSTTFTLQLTSQPTQTVTIPIAVSNAAEATVSPASVSFNETDWNSVKTVTITGLGDLVQDGNQQFQINFGPITGGPNYAALTIPSLTVTNFDTDSPGINVITTGALVTREDGTQTSFRVALGRAPTSNVSLPIVVIENDEAHVISAPIVFTPVNYAAEVTVVIAGDNDDIADGTQPFHVQIGPAVSDDVSYAGRTAPSLVGTNEDNDSPGVIVTPITPLAVTEGGATDGFTVSLTSEPVGTVTIPVQVLDPSQVSASAATLTFNAGNWNSAQPVTVTAVNDLIADDAQPFSIALGPTQASGSDANYQGIVIPNVTGVATDNDTAGLEVNPNVFALPAPTANTTEAGGTTTVQVRLTSQPTAPVTIALGSTNVAEGTVSPAGVVVQPADFAVWQTFTVTGVDDAVQDGNAGYFVVIGSTSDDPKYNNRTTPNLALTNTDNDTAGITVSTTALGATSETGAPTQSFTLVLNSQPTANVTIGVASNDTNEIVVDKASVTFTATTWNVPQTITVSGVNDFIDDGNQARRVDIAPAVSTDVLYNGRVVDGPQTYVTITNNDDDTANIEISTANIEIYDEPSADTFTVVLTSQPLVDVVIPLASDDLTEGTVSPASLTFTAANWNVPQTVTVNSVNDAVVDGDQTFHIVLALAVAVGDTNYNGMNGQDVTVVSRDAGKSCLTIKTAGPALPSGMYTLDPDFNGPIPRFPAYCDMTTVSGGVTGGFTLLSWSHDTDDDGGVPYPGLAQCNNVNFHTCARGTGVPTAALNALFAQSSELAQGQTITDSQVMALMGNFTDLGGYEFAGSFVYGSLDGLTVATGQTTCSAFAEGEYAVIHGTAGNDGETVYLSQSLASGGNSSLLNFGSDSNNYRYSLGNSTGACLTNGTPPASFLGTWQADQYGPEQQNAAGAYSVWVR